MRSVHYLKIIQDSIGINESNVADPVVIFRRIDMFADIFYR